MHCHSGTNKRAPRWTFTDPCKPEVRQGVQEEYLQFDGTIVKYYFSFFAVTWKYRYYYYFFGEKYKKWEDAQADCLTRNMQLATISSSDEVTYIRTMAKQKYGYTQRLWIGLTRGFLSGKLNIL